MTAGGDANGAGTVQAQRQHGRLGGGGMCMAALHTCATRSCAFPLAEVVLAKYFRF